MSNYVCIYHADCADGFGAALAVKVWHDQYHPQVDITFCAAQYGDEPPVVSGSHVLIVDFSFPRSVLIELAMRAASLIVIDHHKSAQADLADLSFCVFDMTRSGAVMTWQELYPYDTDIPLLFRYLQDRDLWQWKLPNSKEISAAIRSYPMTFDQWEKWIDPNLESDLINQLVDGGTAILRYQQREVESIVKKKFMIELAGFHVPCLNTAALISEVGNVLCQGEPFSATYFDTEHKRVWSLRSDDQGIDVAEIARRFGGGGHAHAAGFTMPINRLVDHISSL